MAASSADLRDILALPGPSALPTVHTAPKKTPRAQKPEGISRELYSLIGNHAPSLAAVQQAKAKLKQKPKFGRGNKAYWYVFVFCNPFPPNAKYSPLTSLTSFSGNGGHLQTKPEKIAYN